MNALQFVLHNFMQIIFEAELSLSEGPSKVNENELSLDKKLNSSIQKFFL